MATFTVPLAEESEFPVNKEFEANGKFYRVTKILGKHSTIGFNDKKAFCLEHWLDFSCRVVKNVRQNKV